MPLYLNLHINQVCEPLCVRKKSTNVAICNMHHKITSLRIRLHGLTDSAHTKIRSWYQILLYRCQEKGEEMKCSLLYNITPFSNANTHSRLDKSLVLSSLSPPLLSIIGVFPYLVSSTTSSLIVITLLLLS